MGSRRRSAVAASSPPGRRSGCEQPAPVRRTLSPIWSRTNATSRSRPPSRSWRLQSPSRGASDRALAALAGATPGGVNGGARGTSWRCGRRESRAEAARDLSARLAAGTGRGLRLGPRHPRFERHRVRDPGAAPPECVAGRCRAHSRSCAPFSVATAASSCTRTWVGRQSTAGAIQGFVAAGVEAARRPRFASSPAARADGSYRYSARYKATPLWVTSQVLPALARKAFPLR